MGWLRCGSSVQVIIYIVINLNKFLPVNGVVCPSTELATISWCSDRAGSCVLVEEFVKLGVERRQYFASFVLVGTQRGV